MAEIGEDFRRNGVVNTLQKCLGSLVENQPRKPLEFLLSGIDDELGNAKAGKIKRAVNLISHTNPSLPVFQDNLAEAYLLLSSKYDNVGVSPEDFSEVVFLLCTDLPAYVNVLLLPLVERCGRYFVTFNDFVSGINPCIVLREFNSEIEYQFAKLCQDNDSSGSKSVNEYQLAQLSKVLAFINEKSWTFPCSFRRREVDAVDESNITEYVKMLNLNQANHYIPFQGPPKSIPNSLLLLEAEKELKYGATKNQGRQ